MEYKEEEAGERGLNARSAGVPRNGQTEHEGRGKVEASNFFRFRQYLRLLGCSEQCTRPV